MKSIIHFYHQINSRFYRSILRICGFCGLSFLVTACYGPPSSEYDEYKTKNIDFYGTVISSDSLKPIKNIRVYLKNSTSSYYYYDSTTSYTDDKGNYSIRYDVQLNDEITLTAKDVDDTANGGKFKSTIYKAEISGRDITTESRKVDFKLKRE